MYFLPALTTIWDHYIDPAEELMAVHDEWTIEPIDLTLTMDDIAGESDTEPDSDHASVDSNGVSDSEINQMVESWLDGQYDPDCVVGETYLTNLFWDYESDNNNTD